MYIRLDSSHCTPGYTLPYTGDGNDYSGAVSTTVSGKTCQRWDSQQPHVHGVTIASFGDAITWETSMSDLGNKCRNPHNESGPWCYTTSPEVRWEHCNITCQG